MAQQGRALGPVRNQIPFAPGLRAELRKYVPDEACLDGEVAMEAKAAMQTTLFWNSPSLRIAYFERSLCGCVRLQYRGASDMLIFLPEALESQVGF